MALKLIPEKNKQGRISDWKKAIKNKNVLKGILGHRNWVAGNFQLAAKKHLNILIKFRQTIKFSDDFEIVM